MKAKISLLAIMMLSGVLSLSAGETKTEKFKVYGNCGMCESRIEKAVKAVDGVSSADWDKETKMLEVTFDDAKTDAKTLQTAIAKVGHDTDLQKASDESYKGLPECCKYERAAAKTSMSGCKDKSPACCSKSHKSDKATCGDKK